MVPADSFKSDHVHIVPLVPVAVQTIEYVHAYHPNPHDIMRTVAPRIAFVGECRDVAPGERCLTTESCGCSSGSRGVYSSINAAGDTFCNTLLHACRRSWPAFGAISCRMVAYFRPTQRVYMNWEGTIIGQRAHGDADVRESLTNGADSASCLADPGRCGLARARTTVSSAGSGLAWVTSRRNCTRCGSRNRYSRDSC